MRPKTGPEVARRPQVAGKTPAVKCCGWRTSQVSAHCTATVGELMAMAMARPVEKPEELESRPIIVAATTSLAEL